MSIMSLINSGIKSMENSSSDSLKKEKMLKEQYCEKNHMM